MAWPVVKLSQNDLTVMTRFKSESYSELIPDDWYELKPLEFFLRWRLIDVVVQQPSVVPTVYPVLSGLGGGVFDYDAGEAFLASLAGEDEA